MSVNSIYLCGLADYYLSEDLSDITFLIDDSFFPNKPCYLCNFSACQFIDRNSLGFGIL
jgi:hypothetical protein